MVWEETQVMKQRIVVSCWEGNSIRFFLTLVGLTYLINFYTLAVLKLLWPIRRTNFIELNIFVVLKLLWLLRCTYLIYINILAVLILLWLLNESNLSLLADTFTDLPRVFLCHNRFLQLNTDLIIQVLFHLLYHLHRFNHWDFSFDFHHPLPVFPIHVLL